jgi:hypothetical protein
LHDFETHRTFLLDARVFGALKAEHMLARDQFDWPPLAIIDMCPADGALLEVPMAHSLIDSGHPVFERNRRIFSGLRL